MSNLSWRGADTIVGTMVQLIANLTMTANTILGRPAGTNGAPSEVAVADNTVVGRNGGNLTAIAMGAQSLLMRAAGNIVAQAVSANEVIGRLAGNLGVIPAVSTATVSSVMVRDAAGRAAIVTANADDGIPARAQLETKRNGAYQTAILFIAVNPINPEQVMLNADVYVWGGAGPHDPAIGGAPVNNCANLAAQINGGVGVTENLRADVAVIGGVDCVIVRPALTPGGAAVPGNPNAIVNTTMIGGGNEWDCGNGVNMNVLGGEAYAYNAWGQKELIITAGMVASVSGAFGCGQFPFTPRIWTVVVRSAGGVFYVPIDAFTLVGNEVVCTYAAPGPGVMVAGDTLIITAQA